jgi:hypothetical protein
MADKKITVEIDIETEASAAKLRDLRKQLKQTAVGSADFKQLSAQIRDVEDALEGAKLGAEDLAGSLEAAPGPIGEIFKGLKKVEIATKSWGAALKATGIGLLVSLVGAFAAALSKSDETMKKFEPILIMFEQTLNGLLGALQPLIDGFIELALNVMPYVTQAFKVVYSSVTAVFQSLGKLGGAVVKLFKGDFKGAWEDAKASVTSFSTNYDSSVQRFEAGTKKITKTQKENLDQQKKDRDDAAEKAKQQREAELKELMDGQKEAMLELLSEREKEEYNVNEHYSKLIFLATKYGEDTTQLKKAQADRLAEIDKKYTDKEAEKLKERLDKEKEFWKKAEEEATKKRDKAYENGLKALDREVAFIAMRNETLLQGTRAYFAGRLDLINKQEQRELADKELTESEKLAIEKKYQKLRDDVKKDEQRSNAMAVAATLDALSSLGNAIASSYDEEAKTSKSAFEKRKKLQKATAIMSAASGIIQILSQPSTLPSPFDFITKGINAAALGISTAIQIKNIDKTQFEGGGSSSINNNVLPAPKLPSLPSISIPQIQTGGGMNPTQQIGETIAGAQKPIKAYVVSGDISSQIALDRRTNRAATFAGG